ncbi:DNA-directed RNA polymerase III complex subunit rpc37-like protein [Colletotrichum truncatum]|uniref:DNA-directed RNA polymerase III complex subunit rpc37-like protein n=1 Tax=Colletotrichum truncatum TaxID=5467 RepID=A0ACC3YFF3_COLTU|nr:DNA-directed RNA polymerase III complex subunit rpc37-like protein [Colletotrichum truncatum]KAF6788287.1 DNA-directed RNA polymerase III complex subunit rpc37-like protein [Colletotrichum truncatum]
MPAPTAEMGPSDDSFEEDPVIASYDVFFNPSLPQGRKLWVLQQPNRTDPRQATPTEMRLKARAGMVEVDVPLDYTQSYDKEKGMKWGRQLKASLESKNGGTHGLSGGFGVGAPPPRPKKRGEIDLEDEMYLEWPEAVRQDKVLRTQTLGGQCPDHKEVQYMIGVFQGKDLHLTPVTNLVHLRPQLHHVDAVAQQDRNASAAAAAKDNAAAAAGAGAGASGAGGQGAAARAIHMTIKTTPDGATAKSETMADRLRAVQIEPWRKLKYTDENDEAAWDIYQESLILRAPGDNRPPPPTDEEDEEKKKAAIEAGEAETKPAIDLAEAVSRLETKWGDDELLEAVSGIKKPKPLTKAEQEAEAAAAAFAEEEARKMKAKARGVVGPRRGGKARAAPAQASSGMDLT